MATIRDQHYAGVEEKRRPIVTPKNDSIPPVVPYSHGQMITAKHLDIGILPVSVTPYTEWYITLNCFLDCENCSVPVTQRRGAQLRLSNHVWIEIIRLINDVYGKKVCEQYGVDAIVMRALGGQPVQVSGYDQIVSMANELPYVVVDTYSDGLPESRTKGLFERMVSAHPKRYNLSCDYWRTEDGGTDRERKGYYGRKVATALKRAGVPDVNLNVVLMGSDNPDTREPGNIHELPLLMQYASSEGLSLTAVGCISHAHWAQGRSRSTYPHLFDREKHVLQLYELCRWGVKFQKDHPVLRNSGAHWAGMFCYGVDQLVTTRPGYPSATCISASGRMRRDPMMESHELVHFAPGIHRYGWMDYVGIYEQVTDLALIPRNYLTWLCFELEKWESFIHLGDVPIVPIDPLWMVGEITDALKFWELPSNQAMLEDPVFDEAKWRCTIPARSHRQSKDKEKG